MGFVSRRDIRNYVATTGYLWRPNRQVLREVFSAIEFNRTDNLGGGVQSSVARFRLAEFTSQRGDSINFRWLRHRENFAEPFEIFPGTTVPKGNYVYDNYGVILRFADHRRLSGDVAYFGGTDFDGSKRAGRGSINWRPSKHLGLEAAIRYGQWRLPAGEFTTRLMTLRARIVFSNTLSWVNLAQYDNLSRVLGINSRLHWSPQAGRELFFVINHNLIDDVETGLRSTDADITLKINYTLRF